VKTKKLSKAEEEFNEYIAKILKKILMEVVDELQLIPKNKAKVEKSLRGNLK
jgi:hypothetical protein